jgi:hypothetical protein
MGPMELKMQPTLHFRKKPAIEIKISSFYENVLWVAFSIPSDSLALVNNPVPDEMSFIVSTINPIKKIVKIKKL